jgi:hypothetical protein
MFTFALPGMEFACLLLLLSDLTITSASPAPKSQCLIPTAIPFILSREYTCLPGLYCPFLKPGDNSTLPAMCPPTIDCSIKRLTGGWCAPQGAGEPRICPKGFFCPEPTSSKTCPEGSWCPRGSSGPIECEWLSSCPEGSSFRTHWGLLLLCAVIDAVIISLSYWNVKSLSSKQKLSWAHVEAGGAVESSSATPPAAAAASAPPHTSEGSALSLGFSKMNRTGSIELTVVHLSVSLPAASTCAGCCRAAFASCEKQPRPLNSAPPAPPRNIISQVSAVFKPGRLHAIMGPSGSGKTTLLHCIAGKLAASSGSIFLNSTSTVDPRSIKKSVGFVPQDDVMLRTLTVEEIILHRREPSFNRNHLSPITNHQPPITNQHV